MSHAGSLASAQAMHAMGNCPLASLLLRVRDLHTRHGSPGHLCTAPCPLVAAFGQLNRGRNGWVLSRTKAGVSASPRATKKEACTQAGQIG